jgi:hypothetical protein
MIIKPMVRNNICINAHPQGCSKNVENQIEYTVSYNRSENKRCPKNVLVIGSSNGYGLASRIVASFGYNASTIGVSLEKAGTESRGGTPGWYNNLAFEEKAKEKGSFHCTIGGDAFSDEIKKEVISIAKNQNIKFDLVVYSLASPMRKDPITGEVYQSCIKPIGSSFEGKTINIIKEKIEDVLIQEATEKEIEETIHVMGSEDWHRWIFMLQKNEALSKGFITIAYSYIGPKITHELYKDGTIGRAKEDLEKNLPLLNDKIKELEGRALVCVNKGIATRSSAIIPVIPLYLSCLFKVMKERGTHEGVIEQINRLFVEKLYSDGVIPLDSEGRIRLDEKELDEEVQRKTSELMSRVIAENNIFLADIEGYKKDFLQASGFCVDGIDYEKDVEKFDVLY